MDTAMKAGTAHTILLAEFMAPVRVLAELDGKGCRRYSVQVTGPDGSQTPMLLLEFGCSSDSPEAFEASCAVLNRLQNLSVPMPRYWAYSTHPDRRYILLDVDPGTLLSLEDMARKPLKERLDILAELLAHAAELDDRGILLRELDWSCVYLKDGQYRFWDHTRGLLSRDLSDRRSAMADLAGLVYHGILGQELAAEDLRPNLTVLLCHVSDWDGFSGFCDTLEDCLSRTGDIRISRLLEDLDYIRELPPEPSSANRWEPWQCVADFLCQNPLYPYVRKNERGKEQLRVVLFGQSELRSAFFDQILSVAQMLDTQLQIHVIAPDAEEFWRTHSEHSPLLKQGVRVNGDDRALDPALTGHDAKGTVLPLAELTFTAAESFSARELLQNGTGCLFLLEPYSDTVSFEICALVNQTRDPLLVAIRQDRPVAHTEIGKHHAAVLHSFRSGGNGSFSETTIYRKALGVQTYYEKFYDQRISAKKILQNFHNETNQFYNLRSSVRSALSIPYKFHSCGLDETENERFHQEVLKNPDRKLRNRLIWLEHRSWQAHLIVGGWQLNPEDFDGGFDHRKFSQKNEALKWHACLRGSDDTGVLPLSNWDWEMGDLSALDPLDRLSVEIHRALTAKAERHQEDLKACLHSMKGRLTPAQYQQVRNSVKQLRERVTNAEVGWSRTCRELGWDTPCDSDIEALKTRVRELVDRNARRDYKRIDLSIIEAIPYLNRQRTFRHVCSLCAGHPWHNVAAAMLLEPETLTLVTDGRHDVTDTELGHCTAFLRDRRNLKTEIHRCDPDQLPALPEDTVLDVTGADADQLLAAQGHPLLGKLPMVAYRDGGLVSPDGSCAEVRFYPRNHTITVEEMMSLTGTTVLSEYSDIPMHGMFRYKALWAAMQEMTMSKNDNYFKLCNLLKEKFHAQQIWSVRNRNLTWESSISPEAASVSGFDKLLDQLKAAKLIQDNSTPAHVKLNRTAFYEDTKYALKIMKERIQKADPLEDRRFELKRVGDDQWRIWDQFGSAIYLNKAQRTPWVTTYTKAEAESNGLLALLNKLHEKRIITAFSLPDTVGTETGIFAYTPECQEELNELLTAYDHAISAGSWEVYCMNTAPDDPGVLCELEDRSLDICGRTVSGMLDFQAAKCFDILREKQLIEPMDGKLIYEKTQSGYNPIGTFHFRYADYTVRDCLTKEGNALEALVYHTVRNMNFFDDVKLGVSIQWDRQDVDGWDTRNEIDIICTKGMKSWFLSCKMTRNLDKKALTEIRYETDRFGVDGIPIMVTTAEEARTNHSAYSQAKRMGVHVISLTKEPFRKDAIPDGSRELEDQLRAIIGST